MPIKFQGEASVNDSHVLPVCCSQAKRDSSRGKRSKGVPFFALEEKETMTQHPFKYKVIKGSNAERPFHRILLQGDGKHLKAK